MKMNDKQRRYLGSRIWDIKRKRENALNGECDLAIAAIRTASKRAC